MTPPPPSTGEYAETYRTPMSWWLAAVGFAIVVWWVFVLATPMALAVVVGVVALAAGVGLVWRYGSAGVKVGDGAVSACGARIEVAYVGDAVALDAATTAQVRGPDADVRAYLALRPYIATSVRLDICDGNDPTPYWLISSRHPQRLADAITAARRRTTNTD